MTHRIDYNKLRSNKAKSQYMTDKYTRYAETKPQIIFQTLIGPNPNAKRKNELRRGGKRADGVLRKF